MTTRIAADVLSVLDGAEVDGPFLRLVGTLDRQLYVRTDRVLRAAGGTWDRKAKAHVFPGGAAETVDLMLLSGSVETLPDFGHFPSPHPVVTRLLELAELRPEHEVLEPSAGSGAIACAVAATSIVDCVELDEGRARVLRERGCARTVTTADFLTVMPTPSYDRVVMNPPFAKRADIAHVRHALAFLRPEGRLVSVMSAGVSFRQDRAATSFRDVIDDRGGCIVPLPPESFRVSGTSVATVVVVISAGLRAD